jgi:hypothetical protein
MHPVISIIPFLFGILNVVCKVRLISLIDLTDGGCMTDIICACLAVIVLMTTVGGLVLQSDIIAAKEYASDLQTFLGSKPIAEEVKKKEEEYIFTRICLIWS